MRTTLDIPEALIKEAMEITGAKTKSQAITEALKAQIQRAKRQRLLSFKGTIDLEIDLDSTRDRK
jgi:Arc/MetJ family transcription regulator